MQSEAVTAKEARSSVVAFDGVRKWSGNSFCRPDKTCAGRYRRTRLCRTRPPRRPVPPRAGFPGPARSTISGLLLDKLLRPLPEALAVCGTLTRTGERRRRPGAHKDNGMIPARTRRRPHCSQITRSRHLNYECFKFTRVMNAGRNRATRRWFTSATGLFRCVFPADFPVNMFDTSVSCRHSASVVTHAKVYLRELHWCYNVPFKDPSSACKSDSLRPVSRCALTALT